MNETVTNDILHCDEIGQQMFEDFVTERLTEEKLSVWEKMTKRKLGTYKSANASTEIRVGDNVVSRKLSRLSGHFRFVTSSVALLPVSLTLTASPNWPPTLIDDVISRATSGSANIALTRSLPVCDDVINDGRILTPTVQ